MGSGVISQYFTNLDLFGEKWAVAPESMITPPGRNVACALERKSDVMVSAEPLSSLYEGPMVVNAMFSVISLYLCAVFAFDVPFFSSFFFDFSHHLCGPWPSFPPPFSQHFSLVCPSLLQFVQCRSSFDFDCPPFFFLFLHCCC